MSGLDKDMETEMDISPAVRQNIIQNPCSIIIAFVLSFASKKSSRLNKEYKQANQTNKNNHQT